MNSSGTLWYDLSSVAKHDGAASGVQRVAAGLAIGLRETSAARAVRFCRFDKKRVRFRIEGFPYDPGKYWVTVGLSSRETGHLYHVQTQRYLFEVFDAPRIQDRVDVAVAVEVDDL